LRDGGGPYGLRYLEVARRGEAPVGTHDPHWNRRGNAAVEAIVTRHLCEPAPASRNEAPHPRMHDRGGRQGVFSCSRDVTREGLDRGDLASQLGPLRHKGMPQGARHHVGSDA